MIISIIKYLLLFWLALIVGDHCVKLIMRNKKKELNKLEEIIENLDILNKRIEELKMYEFQLDGVKIAIYQRYDCSYACTDENYDYADDCPGIVGHGNTQEEALLDFLEKRSEKKIPSFLK